MKFLKRFLQIFFSICLVANMLPQTAFATTIDELETNGLCEHHEFYDENCGYVEEIHEIPCNHVHTEDCKETIQNCIHIHTEECFAPAEAANPDTTDDLANQEPINCQHVCSEENGCITIIEHCVHVEHDETCGYVAAVEAHDCEYDCSICKENQCTCETENPLNHASDCPAYVIPEISTCNCETRCTEEQINEECPVCSLDGDTLENCVGKTADEIKVTHAYQLLSALPEPASITDENKEALITQLNEALNAFNSLNEENREAFYLLEKGSEYHDNAMNLKNALGLNKKLMLAPQSTPTAPPTLAFLQRQNQHLSRHQRQNLRTHQLCILEIIPI